MTADAPVESTLTRRLRSLLLTAPIHAIEAGKAQRGIDLEEQDLRALSLRAIDAAIEHMGLGYGARRSDLVDALGPMIRASDPNATNGDVVAISDLVVAQLLNENNRRLQFEVPYADFDGTTSTTRMVRFHLLKEEEADDGSVVLKATTEAINLYAGMLEVDVEDAQTAAEAVLQSQIARGAIGAAVATARQARLRSIQYAEGLRSTLRRVRRDVARVDTSDLLRTVQEARAHVAERLQVERSLIEAVEDRVASAEVGDAPKLVELKDALSDCRQRHLRLHSDLLGVHQMWLDEQEHQRFRRPRASALPDLERDVLQVLIAAPLFAVDGILDALVLPLHAPAAPAVFDVAGLVDGLLAVPRRHAEVDLDPVDAELEPIAGLEARFNPATVARVDELLCQGSTLAALLVASRTSGDPPGVRRLLVLRALWAWDPDDGDALVAVSAGPLFDAEYEGCDLTLGGR